MAEIHDAPVSPKAWVPYRRIDPHLPMPAATSESSVAKPAPVPAQETTVLRETTVTREPMKDTVAAKDKWVFVEFYRLISFLEIPVYGSHNGVKELYSSLEMKGMD